MKNTFITLLCLLAIFLFSACATEKKIYDKAHKEEIRIVVQEYRELYGTDWDKWDASVRESLKKKIAQIKNK